VYCHQMLLNIITFFFTGFAHVLHILLLVLCLFTLSIKGNAQCILV
jgi:uncharacterized membrane protein YccF (DUF307 family)